MSRIFALALSTALAVTGSWAQSALGQSTLDVFAELQQPPGNLTVTPDGQIVMSLHQFYGPPYSVATYQNGEVTAFLPQAESSLVTASVLGILSDDAGVVWILDNAAGSDRDPQLVGWDTRQNQLYKTIALADVTPEGSFINDLWMGQAIFTWVNSRRMRSG